MSYKPLPSHRPWQTLNQRSVASFKIVTRSLEIVIEVDATLNSSFLSTPEEFSSRTDGLLVDPLQENGRNVVRSSATFLDSKSTVEPHWNLRESNYMYGQDS
jgi:hypothetical protein